jgi:hypothetical protein
MVTISLMVAPSALADEPNNTPGAATLLPGGLLLVEDSLDGSAGRPDTILGLFDPSGMTLLDSDDNGSSLGNNFASQLLDVPILADGSIFFKVTGSPDSTFVGNHAQNGKYAWFLDVRDPDGQIVPGLSQSFTNEEISPFNQDSIWLLPSASPDPGNPNWVGYTVDMTINNIVGPGTGDSLDFFTFTGLEPFQQFTATLDGDFAALIAIYDGNTRIATSSVFDLIPTLVGTADFLGRVKIGVTGAADINFTGAHIAVGEYSLEVVPLLVPEPASIVLLGVGAAFVGFLKLKHGRRRSKSIC